MALLDLIQENVVRVPLKETSKYEVIRELVDILKDAEKISDPEPIYQAIQKREEQGSTGLENGIAVPHAKTSSVEELTLAIGIAPQGIDFQALDGKPSKVFFLLLAPPDKSGPHIEALAEIARITQSGAFMRLLTSARTAEEVVELFAEE